MPGVKGKCGGRRPGAGRKPASPEGPAEMFGFKAPPHVARWLRLWTDDESKTKMILFSLERSMKFWPEGPARFGHTPKNRRKK
jgi:hypothetical protein